MDRRVLHARYGDTINNAPVLSFTFRPLNALTFDQSRFWNSREPVGVCINFVPKSPIRQTARHYWLRISHHRQALLSEASVAERRDRGPAFKGSTPMEQEFSLLCLNCGLAMTFTARISLPPQVVYRCEPCKEEMWVRDRKDNASDKIR
jgi:hypothetical protein